ncbi:HEPN domain-containing protein [Candidatus Poribacteria bacterium]|nr:HEPN domain-containing protein [Candidatus Poribacteria bacterium]
MAEEHGIMRRISRISSRLYGDLRYICRGEGLTQERLESYIREVTIDRIKLAFSLYTCAISLDEHKDKKDGDYRSIISRCYYCHYHLARAMIFWISRDDIDKHEKLPKNLGKILSTEYAEFIDKLERFRGIRNEVEYSPYPEVDRSLREISEHILVETKTSIELMVCCFQERELDFDENM